MKLIDDAMGKAPSFKKYSEAQEKLEKLQADLRAVRKQLEVTPWSGPSSTKTVAASLLRGEKPVLDMRGNDEPRHQFLLLIRAHESAIEQQRRNVRDALRVVAGEIGPQLRQRHELIVARMAKALRELSAATAEQDALAFECNRRDLGFPGMRPLSFDNARLDYQGSDATNWMAEATEYKYAVGA